MWRVSMFPQVDSLPGTQSTTAIGDRQVDVRLRQHASHVRRHVIGSFSRMRKHRITVRHLALHECLEVTHDCGIGVFTQNQRCARVLNEYVAKAGRDTCGSHEILNLLADVVGPPAGRGDTDFSL